ncbi:MAG TPA: dual specificity protein phosphatase [Ktedonobacterales bacterium]|nr:dual specificity protein phosphatase [Ktedonobacterales bacterium]
MSSDPPFGVSCVTERLYLGGHIGGREHADWLVAEGITHVISVAIELSDRVACAERNLGYRHLYWHDDRQLKPSADCVRTLAWLRKQEETYEAAGRLLRLYVHCAMGMNRGPLMATYLLAATAEIPADEAWAIVKRSRPQVESFESPAYRNSCNLALAGFMANAVPETVGAR